MTGECRVNKEERKGKTRVLTHECWLLVDETYVRFLNNKIGNVQGAGEKF